jgi:Ca2+-binding RTX toxin-like protein
MGNIRIERVPIAAMELGRLRADHLMLVYQQDALDYGYYQDRWWVMEGTRDTNPDGTFTVGVDGADGITTLSEANGGKTAQELLDAIRYPSWRGSKIIPSVDPFQDWGLMAAVARDIDSHLFPYFAFNFQSSPLPTANSSSVIATLLYYIGVDIAANMPSTFLTFTTGTRTLFGTTGDDTLTIEFEFNTVLAGSGKDTLQGSDDPSRLEKLYGGRDDDLFLWTNGNHVYHGGQPGLSYAEDGVDTIDYSGVGTVTIKATEQPVPHMTPDFIATHAGGTDRLFSIEKILWNTTSDTVIVGEGVDLLDQRLLFDLDAQSQSDRGDTLDYTGRKSSLLAAPSDRADIVLIGSAASDGNFSDRGGIWAKSLEWLIGSDGDDRIYAGSTLTGIDGGAGDDVLSGRLAAPLTGASPQGFDIEIFGGAGNDTIISGTGRSLGIGGDGDDIFVLSSISEPGRIVEFVIADAGTSDRLFVPYNFLKPGTEGFAGSELFPILGGLSFEPGAADFLDLPQHAGPGVTGGADQPGFFALIWQTQLDSIFVPDASDGIVDIAGQVLFNRDGNDLLIHVYAGQAVERTFFNLAGEPYQYTAVSAFLGSEAVIRVVGFQEGMLGINFYDLGEGTPFDYDNFAGPGSTDLYPGWDPAAFALTNNGVLTAALEGEPATPVYDLPDEGQTDEREQLIGGGESDIIIAGLSPPADYSSGADLEGGGGDDTLVGGPGRDRLDGGTGADAMSGGEGNDTYIVDQTGDTISEFFNAGLDSVLSSIDYVLPEHVENLTLTGAAILAGGSAGQNRLTGTASANVVAGYAGNDTLIGGGGDDLLDGGEGDDTFVYMFGDGIDTILATTDPGSIDILTFIGVTASDVGVFVSGSDADDAVLRIADGGRVVLDAFFSGASIDQVRFVDGTIWNDAFLIAAANVGGVLLNDAPVARADEGLFTHLSEIVIPKAELVGNDSDFDGDPLTIVSAASTTPGAIAEVTADGDVRVSVAAGQTGPVLFTYTISDGRGGTATGSADITFFANAAPVLSGAPLADQTVAAGTAWSFTIPLDAFTDPDGDPMVYTADLADGSPLPGWLAYDPETRTFQGTPPAGFNGNLAIRVTAFDSVASGSATFVLSVTGGIAGLTLVGTNGIDTLTGGSGNDTIDGRRGRDVLSGGAGDDVFLVAGAAGFDTYDGGEGNDLILGSSGDDIIGVTGSGTLLAGIEAIDGGAGFDILRLDSQANILDLSNVAVTGLERIEGRGGNDTIIGSASNDTIDGGGGNDVLAGGDGDDIFLVIGARGRDTFDGGAGRDLILGSTGDDVLFLANGSANLTAIEAIDLGDGFDRLRLGDGDDLLDLSGLDISGIDRIEGGAGRDRIVASSADDVIFGGSGADTFVFRAGFGDDTIADFQLTIGRNRNGDVIDFSGLGWTSFAEVVASAEQVGLDTVITHADSGSTLTIAGIAIAQLQANDFIV